MKKGITFTIGIALVGWACSLARGQLPPEGVVTWHNGTTDSSPTGSGDVDVQLEYGGLTQGPVRVRYSEMATLEVQFEYAEPDLQFGPEPFLWARSWIWNETSVLITGIEILLEGADFAGWDSMNRIQARAVDPVVGTGLDNPKGAGLATDEIGAQQYSPLDPVTVASSSITRFNDEGSGFTDSLLTINFDDPLESVFVLHYNIIPSPGAAGSTGFTMHMTAIPEPATAVLLIFGGWACVARRRRPS